MATNGAEAFLRAEEEANRLVDELARLKQETESYKTARETLDRAAEGVRGLATRLGELAGQVGGVVETLRSIGTPELLRGQQALASEVAILRQDLRDTQRSIIDVHQRETETIKEDVRAQIAGARVAVRAVRNLVLGSVGLLVIALALLAWLSLARA